MGSRGGAGGNVVQGSETAYNGPKLSDDEILTALENDGYETTTDPKDAIYALRDGTMISGGGKYNRGVRIEDHRMIEAVMDDTDRYDPQFWQKMFARTEILMLIPETREALMGDTYQLTAAQRRILSRLGYKLTRGA